MLPATATAAQAAPDSADHATGQTAVVRTLRAPSDCPGNAICFWDGANFTGNGWYFGPPTFSNCRNAQASGYPAPRSVVNHTGYKVVLNRASVCTIGAYQLTTLGPGGQLADSNPYRIYAYNSTI
ncbi:peptidase inhibitor family I36 protein [Actinomadura terrae]|uniref:peptidase inhibitor family I36 protein n=1 Tax=Actinomadura terrae TaxID=604353 RepID=UPI001FA7EFF4|nr:peptidase inhibitor family I36 protein [Actinomadura terrae]